jgi:aminoglycoside phosphotransferase (APT) family kinase protein
MLLIKDKVKKILEKFDDNLVLIDYSKLTSGNINPMYEIQTNQQTIILRIIPRRYEHYKIDKETYVYSLIEEKTNLAVPKILFIDKSKKIIPFKYYLMTKLSGKMLRFTRLPKRERLELYEQLGKDLAEIHKIHFPKIGWIYRNKISRYENKYSKPLNSWKLVFLELYNNIKKGIIKAKNRKYGKLDKFSFIKLFPRIDKIMDKNSKLIDIKIQAVLIHNDFTLRNILATKENNKWKVTGILDVEFSKTGHNEMEVACLDHFLYDKKNILKYSDYGLAFLKGYTSKIKLSKEFEKRKYLYLLISFLSFVEFDAFDMLISSNEEVKFLYSSILKIIKYFESI